MAEFGYQATQLSEPQARGASVVSPVQTMNTGPNPVANIVMGAVDIFAKGISQNREEEKEKRNNSVVQSYIREQNVINQGIETGQLTADKGAAMSRATFAKYMGSYGELTDQLTKAANALRGNTALGQAEDEVKSQKAMRDRDVQQAQSRGAVFIPGMTTAEQDTIIRAAKSGIAAEVELAALRARNEEARASGRYSNELLDRERKETGLKVVTEVASNNIEAFGSFGTALGRLVRDNKIDTMQAQSELSMQFAKIDAVLTSAASLNPELAAPYRTIFNNLNEIAKKMIDPKANLEDLKSEYEAQIVRAKLVAIADPRVKGAAATVSMFPTSAYVAIQMGPIATEAFLRASQADKFAPQVIGDPQNEKQYLATAGAVLKDAGDKKHADPQKSVTEAQNIFETTLKQAVDLMNNPKGVAPKELAATAAFLASPEVASFASKGLVTSELTPTFYKAFQLHYEDTVKKGIYEKLGQSIVRYVGGKAKNVPLNDAVDIVPTGSGVSLKLKPVEGEMQMPGVPAETGYARDRAELAKAEAALNQLIRVGSHMENHTNYAQHWEKFKHEYFPDRFASPTTNVLPQGTTNSKGTTADALKRELKRLEEAGKPSWMPKEMYDEQVRIIRDELSSSLLKGD